MIGGRVHARGTTYAKTGGQEGVLYEEKEKRHVGLEKNEGSGESWY